MVAMFPTTAHVGNSTIAYLTRIQTTLIGVAKSDIPVDDGKIREETCFLAYHATKKVKDKIFLVESYSLMLLCIVKHVSKINQFGGTLSSIGKKLRHDLSFQCTEAFYEITEHTARLARSITNWV